MLVRGPLALVNHKLAIIDQSQFCQRQRAAPLLAWGRNAAYIIA
jgi:hypothetical protein